MRRSLWLAAMLGLAVASPAFAQVYPSPVFQNTTTMGTATFSGPLNIGSNTAQVNTNINGPAASNRYLTWQTAGVNRWDFRADATAEDPANNPNKGSKFILDARNDDGTFSFQAFSIDRQYGSWQMNTASPITLSGSDP